LRVCRDAKEHLGVDRGTDQGALLGVSGRRGGEPACEVRDATLAMTADRYGHFGEAARKREAAKLEGAFNL